MKIEDVPRLRLSAFKVRSEGARLSEPLSGSFRSPILECGGLPPLSVRRLAAVLVRRGGRPRMKQKGRQAAPQCKAGASSRTPKWQATALQRSELPHSKERLPRTE